jgi:hypothetical protein
LIKTAAASNTVEIYNYPELLYNNLKGLIIAGFNAELNRGIKKTSL